MYFTKKKKVIQILKFKKKNERQWKSFFYTQQKKKRKSSLKEYKWIQEELDWSFDVHVRIIVVYTTQYTHLPKKIIYKTEQCLGDETVYIKTK